MTPEEMVVALRGVQEDYKGKLTIGTYGINIHNMARDAADTIEELLRKIEYQKEFYTWDGETTDCEETYDVTQDEEIADICDIIKNAADTLEELTRKLIDFIQKVTDESLNVSEDSDEVIIKSDPLPESWWGEWTCVYSENEIAFDEGETILVKDFDNAFINTYWIGDNKDHTFTSNRWFCYDKENQIVYEYNSPPPFIENKFLYPYEIKKASDTEIVLVIKDSGYEVRFEKTE